MVRGGGVVEGLSLSIEYALERGLVVAEKKYVLYGGWMRFYRTPAEC
jgi:hypothetical protein